MDLLRLASGMRFYRDTFGSLSSVWLPVAGTLAVSGGGLRGATMADWLNNLISNPEFTADTAGWVAGGSNCIIARRDFAAFPVGSPIAPTGGADDYGIEVASVDNAQVHARYSYSSIAGGSFLARTRAYAPSANTEVRAASLSNQAGASVSADDAWESLQATRLATSGSSIIYLYRGSPTGAIGGDVAYFDAVTCYRQAAAAVLAPWRSPNFVTTLSHRSPAAGVVPWGWMFRRTDNLNYWELRVLPNTAGNDLQIIQVTAGVETVRAEADIDWTSNGVDEIELSVIGTNITTAHKKSGAAVWTAGPSYGTATQGQTERGMGPLFYGTGQNRLDAMEVVGR